MSKPLKFDRLVHSDWSKHAHKRWTAEALRDEKGWQITRLQMTSDYGYSFPDYLNDPSYRTLAGFDFVIGLPAHFLDRVNTDFKTFISTLTNNSAFFEVASVASEVSEARPFFPSGQPKKQDREKLCKAHGCSDYYELLRQCERKTVNRKRAASSVFFTAFATQVGKGTLTGWLEVLLPLISTSTHLWPFDGPLNSSSAPLTIAETYPAEAYHHIGLDRFRGKTRLANRLRASETLLAEFSRRNIQLASEVRMVISQGFGDDKQGEDRFDALVGLVSMIAIVDGQIRESPSSNFDIQRREGWILGQTGLPLDHETKPRETPSE